jgi:hypothetical protein
MAVSVVDAHAHVQKLVSVAKWRPCLRSVLPKSSVLLCVFFVAKRLDEKDFLEEMFPVDGWKCFSLKAVFNWVEKFSRGRSKIADDARPGAEMAKTTVKILLCCGFRRSAKAMGQV